MADLPPYPDSNGDTGVLPNRASSPRTPGWVKVFAIIAILLVLLFVILQFTGGGDHGPRRHSPFGSDLGGRSFYASETQDDTSSGGYPGDHTPHFSFFQDHTLSGGDQGSKTLSSGVIIYGVQQ